MSRSPMPGRSSIPGPACPVRGGWRGLYNGWSSWPQKVCGPLSTRVPIDLGRDAELLAEISDKSGMHIVCATGFYHEHDGAGIPYYWRQRWPEEIAELFLHEITSGIGTTGIRPGVIMIATGDPVSRHAQKVLQGAALAARESGLPDI